MDAMIEIGVIGAGYWGPNLIRNLAEIPSCDLRAIADLSRPRLDAMQARYPKIQTTTDYQSLFDLQLDAVAICTPASTHHQIAKDCLEHGLHVLIEKPMTTSSADARDLIEVADLNDRVLMVGHTFIYNPAVQALKEIIAGGTLGAIHYIDAVRVGLGLFHPTVNVVWDLAPHDVSILLHLLDATPVLVSAEGAACVQPSVEDVAYLTLTFPNGTLTHVRVSWLDPSKARRITVVGSEKMVTYDDVEPNEKLKIYDKGVEALKSPDSFGEFQFNYRYGDIVAPFIEFQEPLRVEAEHFIDCVRTGTQPLTDGHAGLRVVSVIEALQASLRDRGRPISMNGSLAPSVNNHDLEGSVRP
jgi:predicted dehydrogenase